MSDSSAVEKVPEDPASKAEVHCDGEERGPVARVLTSKRITTVAAEEEIPRPHGKRELNGIFGVRKKWAALTWAIEAVDEEGRRIVASCWTPRERIERRLKMGSWKERKLKVAIRNGKARVVRIILDLHPSSQFVNEVGGDVRCLPLVGIRGHVIVTSKKKMVVLFSEDQAWIFYCYTLRRAWGGSGWPLGRGSTRNG